MAQLKMRPYQLELSKPAKEGKNTVVYAPSGSGKSQVAVDILNHLAKTPSSDTSEKCVFYLVNSSLRRQKIEEALSKCNIRHAVYGGDVPEDEVPLKTLMSRNDVIVLTAQVVLNLLQAHNPHKLSFADVSLLVFDECHRTAKKHCYNSIMRIYLTTKQEKPELPLPQVVGLTSNLDVGPRDDIKRAESIIQTLCAHLAADVLSIVKECADDLGKYLKMYPVMEELKIPERENDQCQVILTDHMKEIHEKMDKIRETDEITGRKKERLERSLKEKPEDFGSSHYNRWIKKMRFNVQTIKNCPQKYELNTYITFLIMYNQALIINAQARTGDASSFLQDEFRKEKDKREKAGGQHDLTTTTDWLDTEYEGISGKLSTIADDNPTLVLLKDKFKVLSPRDNRARGILVVETQAAPERLKQWMQSDDDLKAMKPLVLSSERHSNIADIYRVLITSAGKERDLPECTWVIRLMYSSKRIEVIRVKDKSKQPAATWSYSEMVSGAVLNQAAMNVSQMDRECFNKEMEDIQRREMQQQGILYTNEETRRDGMTETYKVNCLRCNTFVCNSTDLRVYNQNHRTSITKNLPKLFQRKPHPKPVAYRDIVITEKLHCRSCDHDWGNFARITDLEMPVLKPEGFVFSRFGGVQYVQELEEGSCTYKNWRQVPVDIRPLGDVEKDIIRELYG